MDEADEIRPPMKPVKGEQLVFPLRMPSVLVAEGFVAAPSNALARRWLNQTGWPERRLLLWGPEGCGKTHLLYVWARRRDAPVLDARELDDDWPVTGAACAIDHLDGPTDERALLHFLNRARESRTMVLFASRHPPSRLAVALPDLASRLRAVMTVAVGLPEDSLRAALLMKLLAERQLVVAQPVMDWLCRHLPRTGSAMIDAVRRLDREALAHGRPITRALARSVLADLLEPVGDDDIGDG